MATQHTSTTQESGLQVMRQNWQVMKPFVHFAFKAMAVIGSALIGIIKLLPALARYKDDSRKSDKIIKI